MKHLLWLHTRRCLLDNNLNIFLSVGYSWKKKRKNESHCSNYSNRTAAFNCGIPVAVTFVMH